MHISHREASHVSAYGGASRLLSPRRALDERSRVTPLQATHVDEQQRPERLRWFMLLYHFFDIQRVTAMDWLYIVSHYRARHFSP